MRRAGRLLAVAGMVVALATVGIDIPGGASVVQARGGPPIPEFRPGPCPVELPTKRHVDCGMLIVPEVRDATFPTRTIQVAVAIVRARNPLPDPIIFAMGGPDYPAIDPFSIFYFQGTAFARHRDIILVDSRGIGSSRPFLGCPELDQLDADTFPEGANDRQYLGALRACHDRLTGEGIDLSAYGFIDAALDIRDLRIALGIDRWNLVALSAGGEAGLELMRLDPGAIRSVILDSEVTRAYQPTVDYWVYGDHLMKKAFRGCAAQPDCAAAYPDLQRRFYAEVRRLDRHPLTAEIAVAGGGSVTWELDGAFLLEEAVYFAGYPEGASELPEIADYLARGNILDYVAGIVLEPPFPFNDFIASGRTWASRCRDAFAFQTDATVDAASTKAPKVARFFDLQWDQRKCRQWDVGRSDPAGYGYLDSDLPVLTLRGEWDNSPTDAGRILEQARHFPNGYAYTFPNRGHIQLFDFNGGDISCPRGIAADFMAHPRQRPDSSCIADMPHLVFGVDGSGASADSVLTVSRDTNPWQAAFSFATPRGSVFAAR